MTEPLLEDLHLDGLTHAALEHRLQGLEAQLRRGVPVERYEPIVDRVGELRRLLRTPDELDQRIADLERELAELRAQRRAARARARAERIQARVRTPIEDETLDGLDVQGLLDRRRRLQSAQTRAPERRERIRARVRELDRLLVVEPRDWGSLRAAVRLTQAACTDLGASDLAWDVRRDTVRKAQRSWARGMWIIEQVLRVTAGEHADECRVARECALEAWRWLTEASNARVRTLREGPGDLCSPKIEGWGALYQEHGVDWPR
jgi:multidrug efflux pump subunit AcrA (membrane-fusion protein)